MEPRRNKRVLWFVVAALLLSCTTYLWWTRDAWSYGYPDYFIQFTWRQGKASGYSRYQVWSVTPPEPHVQLEPAKLGWGDGASLTVSTEVYTAFVSRSENDFPSFAEVLQQHDEVSYWVRRWKMSSWIPGRSYQERQLTADEFRAAVGWE